MRTTTIGKSLALLLALACPALAQAPPPAPAPAPAPAADAAAKLTAEWQALEAEYAKAEQAFWNAYQAAKTDAEREKLLADPAGMPAQRFAPRVREFAGKAGKSDAGLAAALWLLGNAEEEDDETGAKTTALVTRLVADHLASPRLTDLAQWLVWGGGSLLAGEGERALRTMREKSPHRAVQAAATFALAQVLAEGGRKPEALALLETLQKDFAGTDEATQAKGLHFELTRLQIGMEAPDFEATDTEGKAFKLSDYRGKVVVIDFWGYW